MSDSPTSLPSISVVVPTPILIVEDTGTSSLNISEQFKLHQERLVQLELDGPVQIRTSNDLAQDWIDAQPDGAMRLIILDLNLRGGRSSLLLPLLRDSNGQNIHPALHPNAIIIGWSAADDAAQVFKDGGADGFISKNRTLQRFVSDVLQIAYRRTNEHETWVCLE